MTQSLRVLILAGDPLARGGLAALLAGQELLHVVGQSPDGDDVGAAFEAYRPDVVVWDMGWEPGTRMDALSALADQGALILAILGDETIAAELWAAGVRGLVGRAVSSDALAAALGALAQGLAVFEPAQSALLPLPRGEPSLSPVEALTPRELDVLHAMADGLSNKLIARRLEISEHTVKFHVNAILGKLGAQSRTEAVVRATRAGILLL